jgi:hypothetical protein
LRNTYDAAVDDNAESGAQRRLDVAHDLLWMKFRTCQNVNFGKSAAVISDGSGGNDTAQCGEKALGANFDR